MENNEFNKKVLDKLEHKISVYEFVKKEKIENKKLNSNKNKFLISKIAAAVILTSFIGGNVYTFATYKENLVSWSLKKIGIVSEYNEIKQDVGISQKDLQGTELTITDYGMDANNLIVGYKLKFNEKPENNIYEELFENAIIKDGEDLYNINSMEQYYSHRQMFQKISDTEYEIYSFYSVNSSKFINEKISFVNTIELKEKINTEDGVESGKTIGKWDFDIELNKEKLMLENEEYLINCKEKYLHESAIFAKPVALEQSKLLTKMKIYLNDVNYDYNYSVEILDEDGNKILDDNMEEITGGGITLVDVIFKKVDLNSKISVNIYEKEEDVIKSSIKFDIDLSKDLKEVKREESIKNKTIKFNKVELTYDENIVDLQENMDYGESEKTKEYELALILNKIYGDEKYEIGAFLMNSYKNKFETDNLREIADKIIEEQKQYLENSKAESIKEEKINNISMITWIQGTEKYSVFLNNDDVYIIQCSNSSGDSGKLSTDIINSIQIN